jgi:predicted DNA-binding transcriptional regulator
MFLMYNLKMEQENLNNQEIQKETLKEKSVLNNVTPLSKYSAMILFIIMPFIGGWIGYSYAPEKVVEVERVVVEKIEVEAGIVPIEPVLLDMGLPPESEIDTTDWVIYNVPGTNLSFKHPPDYIVFDKWGEEEVCGADTSCYENGQIRKMITHKRNLDAGKVVPVIWVSVSESGNYRGTKISSSHMSQIETKQVLFNDYELEGDAMSTQKVTTINNITTLLSKRNYGAMAGLVYSAKYLLSDGTVVSFSGEMDPDIVNGIYTSVTEVE